MTRGTGSAVLLVCLVGLAILASNSVDAVGASSRTYDSTGGTLVMTADASLLLAVNPDSDSVSVLDVEELRMLAEIRVGTEPKSITVHPSAPIAYVANYGSDTISVIDLEADTIVDTVSTGDRPAGVAISRNGALLAVAEYGDDAIRLLDTETLTTEATIAVADRPYALAYTPNDGLLVVVHLLCGTVTLINTSDRTVQMVDTWANVAPAPGVTINAEGTRAYLPQTMAHGLGRNTQFDNTVFAKVSVIDLVGCRHVTSEHISLPEKDQPVGLPWAAALAKEGSELWVVNAASNDISILNISDPTRPRRVAHVAVADNPRGIVIDESRQRAYVNNVLAGTVSVIDTSSYSVVDEVAVTHIPLPPVLLVGKRLFHTSARSDVSKAAWISCNTCHIEGEQDGRTWLLQYVGDVPLGSDPVVRRNTTSLLGMVETYPLRWSAEWDESADSEFSIRFEQFGTGLIDGEMNATLGVPNQGRSYELDCLATYIDSLRVPEHQLTLTEAQERGKAWFESEITGCVVCHPTPLYTDLRQHDVGTVDGKDSEWFGPLIDTPTLRFLYDSAPYFHDGSAQTLYDAVTFPSPNNEHNVKGVLTEDQIDDLIQFLLALPYRE